MSETVDDIIGSCIKANIVDIYLETTYSVSTSILRDSHIIGSSVVLIRTSSHAISISLIKVIRSSHIIFILPRIVAMHFIIHVLLMWSASTRTTTMILIQPHIIICKPIISSRVSTLNRTIILHVSLVFHTTISLLIPRSIRAHLAIIVHTIISIKPMVVISSTFLYSMIVSFWLDVFFVLCRVLWPISFVANMVLLVRLVVVFTHDSNCL